METTIVKGLRMLEALAFSEGPRALTDMAKFCGVTKSNAYRLLKTLEECRYVRQDVRTRTYEPTMRLWELGTRFFNRVNLTGAAGSHLQALAQATGESVYLSVVDHDEVIYVDKVDSAHAVRAYVGIGERAPLYCTGTGKAMLAYLAPETIERVCRNLKPYTPNTVTDANALKAQLAEIRARGYSVTVGEWRPGVMAFAAPIRTPTGIVLAGVSVVGPLERMREANAANHTAALLETAGRIAKELGCAGPPLTAAPTLPKRKPTSTASRLRERG